MWLIRKLLFFSFLFDASENKTNNFTRLQIYFKEKTVGISHRDDQGKHPLLFLFFFPHLNMQKTHI